MEVDGARRAVSEGDAILIPPGAWHQLRATDGPVRLLCCCAPPYSDDDTFFA
jgi:mannose-6-phosphate isomerase-like protein (cupin superfamily)